MVKKIIRISFDKVLEIVQDLKKDHYKIFKKINDLEIDLISNQKALCNKVDVLEKKFDVLVAPVPIESKEFDIPGTEEQKEAKINFVIKYLNSEGVKFEVLSYTYQALMNTSVMVAQDAVEKILKPSEEELKLSGN